MTAGRIALVAGAIVVVAGSIALLALLRDASHPAAATSQVAARPPHPPTASVPTATQAPDRAPEARSREREQLLTTVRSSGRGDEPWNGQAADVFAAFERLGAHVDGQGCYVVGCAATLTFESATDYQRFVSALDASDAYRAWTGGKRLTEPEADPNDSRITLAVILYRPD